MGRRPPAGLLPTVAGHRRSEGLRSTGSGLAIAGLLAIALSGCSGREAAPPAKGGPPAPPVSVAAAVERPVGESETFVGRIEAVERVELRPRVSGYLQRVAYVQGAAVAAGDVLFEIDPEPFRVEVGRLEAEVARARNRLDLARAERERTARLVESGAVSRQELDERSAAARDAEAALAAGESSLAAARLALGYTRVQAPIAGRSGRAEVTAGNFVTAGQTVLTTLVRQHPVYVAFEADEQTFLRAAASRPGAGVRGASVEVGLATETGFPARGRVEFVDNRVNAQTGTILARALLDNRDARYTPGLYARVRLSAAAPAPAVLVDDRAIGTDQTRRFVLVVDESGRAVYRQVVPGGATGGLRVIREGLAAGERVIVEGQQRVRPGMAVQPVEVPMDPRERASAPAAGGAAPAR
jgi:RND family efflux transporter MFP subunit